MCQRVTLSRFCSRCRRIHGNKCLREEDLHKCENWLTERRSGNTGILTNLPTSILKDGGHKSFFITFLSLQRDCENLTSYNVVFFFSFFFFHFSEWVPTPQLGSEQERTCAEEISDTQGSVFISCFQNQCWSKCLRLTWLSLLFQPSPTWDQRTQMFIDGIVSLSSVKRPKCIESLCSVVSEYRRVGFVPAFWLDFYFVFLKSLEMSLLTQ